MQKIGPCQCWINITAALMCVLRFTAHSISKKSTFHELRIRIQLWGDALSSWYKRLLKYGTPRLYHKHSKPTCLEMHGFHWTGEAWRNIIWSNFVVEEKCKVKYKDFEFILKNSTWLHALSYIPPLVMLSLCLFVYMRSNSESSWWIWLLWAALTIPLFI